MIAMHTARTLEVDEIDDAIDELLEQIDLDALLQNSVGIIVCHCDFVDAGVTDALCQRLPFDVIGMTSMANATEAGYDMYGLSLAVLTSDDIHFSVAMTDALCEQTYRQSIAEAYQIARAPLAADPSFVFALFPYIGDVSGSDMTQACSKACGEIPVWGTLTSNVTVTHGECITICNGVNSRDGFAMILFEGSFQPTFVLKAFPEPHSLNKRGLVTRSKGCLLRTINDVPLTDYLRDFGIELSQANATTVPLLVYYDGATAPVALGTYTIFDDNSVLIGGEVPEGSQIAVGDIDHDTIVGTAKTGLDQIFSSGKRNGCFLFPCVTRYVMLSPDQNEEMRLVQGAFEKSGIPLLMGYAGGEVCPVLDADGCLQNRFHNYTFIGCVF